MKKAFSLLIVVIILACVIIGCSSSGGKKELPPMTENGWLGVVLIELSKETITGLGLENRKGALAAQLFLGSPAEYGGLRPGDFITHLNGREIKGVQQLSNTIRKLRPGEKVIFSIIRDNQQKQIQVLIGERNEQITLNNAIIWPGFTVTPLNDQIRQYLQLDNNIRGLIITYVNSESPADIIGLKQYDRIISINGNIVNDIAEFYRILNERTTSEMWFGIIRDNNAIESLRFTR